MVSGIVKDTARNLCGRGSTEWACYMLTDSSYMLAYQRSMYVQLAQHMDAVNWKTLR